VLVSGSLEREIEVTERWMAMIVTTVMMIKAVDGIVLSTVMSTNERTVPPSTTPLHWEAGSPFLRI
jgi:hypothetical protein